MKKTVLFIVLVFAFQPANGQELRQNIVGQVIDKTTQTPLIGATIKILESDPIKGAVTDLDGFYQIENVSIGRYSLEVSYLGYQTLVIPEVLVISSRSTQLDIELEQALREFEEIVITPPVQKGRALNDLSMVSTRSFSVEEARRYAGGFDDPARLASAFAGVAENQVDDNGIVVRGNSPKGVQWRIEGIEVPNPSHFQGAEVAGAGLFTLLSSHTMANSDFYTGAFPAEYGNALSGVFDINLRSGNPFERSSTFQVGIIGLDFATEGPFKKGSDATYLINYRYSTFGLIQPVLPEDANVLAYQDLSFKFKFPTKSAGTFELWGVGGLDDAEANKEPETNSDNWEYFSDRATTEFGFDLGSLGLNHNIILNPKAFLKTTLAVSGNKSFFNEDIVTDAGTLADYQSIDQEFVSLSLSPELNVQHSPQWKTRMGFVLNQMDNSIEIRQAQDFGLTPIVVSKDKEVYNRVQGHLQTNYSFSNGLQFNTGLHVQSSDLVNDDVMLEPRLGVRYTLTDQSQIFAGYGKHSMTEDPKIYSAVDVNGNELNRDLGFTKAHHGVAGFQLMLNPNLQFETEIYFQYLYDVPIIEDSTFSMLNFVQDWYFDGDLSSTGKGRNYGIDLSLERFLDDGYYYLVTGSLFKSEYQDGFGTWRDTRFDRVFNLNALFGKEWIRNRTVPSISGINIRANLQGGQRVNPLDYEQSIEDKLEVYDLTDPFSDTENARIVIDFTYTLTRNRARTSRTWAIQIKNLLGSKSFYGYDYNYETNEMDKSESAIIVPNISYKIEF